MSKLLVTGLVVGTIGLAAAMADAGQRYHRAYYYGRYSACCGCQAATAAPSAAPGAPTVQSAPVPPTPAPPAGQTARSTNDAYRSYSAEPAPAPGVAPPAVSSMSPAPAYGGYINGGDSRDPGNLNATQNNPSGRSGTFSMPSYEATGGMMDTANHHNVPYQGVMIYGGGGGGGGSGAGAGGGGSTTQGGTANRPY